MSEPVAAAYGFRIGGLADHRWLAAAGAEPWPELTMAEGDPPGGLEVSLDPGTLRLRVRADLDHAELVHPLLGRVGSQLALTRGGDAMHAGAIAGARGAWGLIGPKGSGKSTLLAALAATGVPVVTDDVLVFADGTAFAGPRCIDLRAGADRFGAALDVRPDDPRRRIALPMIKAEHPLVGFIHLEWRRSAPRIEAIDHRDAVKRLLALRSEKGYPVDPVKLLDLAVLPAVVLSRSRSWDALSETAALVGQVIGLGAAVGGGPAQAAA